MNKNIQVLIASLVVVAAGVGGYMGVQKPTELPLMFRFIEEKMNSIITPKPPIGNTEPVVDLRGTWKSQLPGKGVQVYGKFTTGPGTTSVYEDGDMELIIDNVANNVATGKVRYPKLCVTATTVMPKPLKSITVPTTCTVISGYSPISIHVTGSRLDFGTVTTNSVTVAMQGTFVTDIMSGSATVTMPGYGGLKGEFHLHRQ